MGTVFIQPETTKNPITLIGEMAGVCYGAPVDDKEKNYKRGIHNLKSGHGRTWEFPDVYLTLDGAKDYVSFSDEYKTFIESSDRRGNVF